MISNESFMLEIGKQQRSANKIPFIVLRIGSTIITLIDDKFLYSETIKTDDEVRDAIENLKPIKGLGIGMKIKNEIVITAINKNTDGLRKTIGNKCYSLITLKQLVEILMDCGVFIEGVNCDNKKPKKCIQCGIDIDERQFKNGLGYCKLCSFL